MDFLQFGGKGHPSSDWGLGGHSLEHLTWDELKSACAWTSLSGPKQCHPACTSYAEKHQVCPLGSRDLIPPNTWPGTEIPGGTGASGAHLTMLGAHAILEKGLQFFGLPSPD